MNEYGNDEGDATCGEFYEDAGVNEATGESCAPTGRQ